MLAAQQGLALKHHLKLSELKRLNRITGTGTIFVGQVRAGYLSC